MKFDVATFTSFWLITFLCCALITTALARMFAGVTAFRYWSAGFYLLATASACFALRLTWHTDMLLVISATLALQSRILIWSGTRSLFGFSVPWRAALAVSALFCVLYSIALRLNVPIVLRALLLCVFFLPCRAATLYEVCRKQRPHLGRVRVVVIIGATIATLNAIVPLALVLLDRANLSLLPVDPRSTSAVYAVVFAGDLLLASGLIVLALKLALVERAMLATLDRGTGEWLAGARGLRAGLESQTNVPSRPAMLQSERRTARVDAARQWPESV